MIFVDSALLDDESLYEATIVMKELQQLMKSEEDLTTLRSSTKSSY